MKPPLFPRILAVLGTAMRLSGPAAGQPMLTFPEDTVIAEACEDFLALDTRLFGLNLTNEPFRLYWRKTQESFPIEAWTLLIIDGLQYPPSVASGSVALSGQDSVEVVFDPYSDDTMAPGDTLLCQIVVYNRDDSLSTARLLTCIITCPETTHTPEAGQQPGFSVYPNPTHGEVRFLPDASMPGDRFDIYTLTGERVRSLPVAGAGLPVAVHDWPAGTYVVCLVGKGRILARQSLVITP